MRIAERWRQVVRTLQRERGAMLILLLALIGILGGWSVTRSYVAQRQHEVFNLAVRGAAEAVSRRLADYAQVLRGGAGFMQASRYVSRDEWKTYVERLELALRYPGIQGMAYAEVIEPAARSQLEAAMREDGLTDFKVWPAGERGHHAVVTMIEPVSADSAKMLGFDMLSDPIGQQTLDLARDLGEPVLSGVVRLAYEQASDSPAWSLLYMPLYRHGALTDSVEARRRELAGVVFAPFRIEQLLRGVLGESARNLVLEVYDLKDDGGRELIFSELGATPEDGGLVEEVEIQLPGRRWLLHVHATPGFMAVTASSLPLTLLLAGAVLLTLLSFLLLQRARQARRIEVRATEMTAELRSSEERFRQVVDTMPSGVLIAGSDGCIQFANRQLATIFGYANEDMRGLPVEALIAPELREAHRHDRGQFLQDAGIRLMGRGRDLQGMRRDGSFVPLEIALAPLAAGEEVCVLALVTDITDRHRHERELAEAKLRAETASQAKSAFLANMSHEIRTPLNAVLGMAQLLGFTQLDARQQDYLRTLHSAGSSLLSLLNDILDLSRVEAGQMTIVRMPFRLADPIRRVEELLLVALRQKGLQLRIEIDASLPPVIEGDAQRIQQVLANLLGNAVKFTEQGEIRLQVAPAELGKTLRFRVSDTGIGMTEAQMQSLFVPFTQADNSVTRRFGGSGLGLAICKRLVGLMGGQIGVSSQLGQGSEFWFSIPLLAADEAGLPVESGVAEPVSELCLLTGMRVLVVEDNPVNQRVARNLLEEAGVVIELAEDGAQAVECLRQRPAHFHAVLMDVQMPVMDGLQATRLIRQTLGLSIPVIGLSAGVLPTERQGALDAGMDDFASKPLDAMQVLGLLARHARRMGFVPAVVPSATPATSAAPTATAGCRVPVIAGLDPTEALIRLGNKTTLYREILALFLREEAQFMSRLSACLAAGDRRGAARHLHTLKSTAGNIGANHLSCLARDAEERVLRELPDDQLGLAEIGQELAGLLPLIEQALAADTTVDEPVSPPVPGAYPPSRVTFPALVAALRANDFQAIELFAVLRTELRAQIGDVASHELAEAIEMLDFDRALRLLSEHIAA